MFIWKPEAILRPPKWRDMSQVRPSVQSDETIHQKAIPGHQSKPAGATQGLRGSQVCCSLSC